MELGAVRQHQCHRVTRTDTQSGKAQSDLADPFTILTPRDHHTVTYSAQRDAVGCCAAVRWNASQSVAGPVTGWPGGMP